MNLRQAKHDHEFKYNVVERFIVLLNKFWIEVLRNEL